MEFKTVRSEILKKYCRGKGLDIGASENTIKTSIDPHYAQIDTQDIVASNKEKVTYLSPADKIPVSSNTYDFICASHVLEHLNNPIKALAEWMRILRPGGYIIAFMPDCRLWITDRKRFEIEELRYKFFASLELLLEDFKNDVRNQPDDWLSYKPYHFAYYYEHKYIWTIGYAIDMFRYIGFEILEKIEVPLWFIEIFNKELLPKYIDNIFVSKDANTFTEEVLLLQERTMCLLLDYSFIIVGQKRTQKDKLF